MGAGSAGWRPVNNGRLSTLTSDFIYDKNEIAKYEKVKIETSRISDFVPES